MLCWKWEKLLLIWKLRRKPLEDRLSIKRRLHLQTDVTSVKIITTITIITIIMAVLLRHHLCSVSLLNSRASFSVNNKARYVHKTTNYTALTAGPPIKKIPPTPSFYRTLNFSTVLTRANLASFFFPVAYCSLLLPARCRSFALIRQWVASKCQNKCQNISLSFHLDYCF
jgi:hypothetical protein